MRNWSKKPNKGTSYAKFSRNRVNFRKTNKVNYPLKKDDSLDGVWEVNPTTNQTTYYVPERWKKREAELNKKNPIKHDR